MRKDSVSVGVIGFGTVGSGTVRLLLENRRTLKDRLGFAIDLKRIADPDTKRDRGINLPEGMLVAGADAVLDDPGIDIVVELIGGIRPAKDFILRAIGGKKHVVTANKALLATEGNEIFSEAARQGVGVGFEASVAGGIPIIKVIREGLIANRILSVYGIINGTSNYILTKMTEEGVEFGEALEEARRLGYAEADPTFDIEGIDSAHKLAILASLAYGIPLSFDKVHTEGITGITAMDIAFASELGYKIKLLAIAKGPQALQPTSEGNLAGASSEALEALELRVHPTMLPKDYLISKVDGVFNAIYVEGDAVGQTLYYGRGAGDMPTGSAVVSDIADIARSIMTGSSMPTLSFRENAPPIKNMEDISSMYYFRFTALDRPGVLSKIAGILGGNNISIASVIQKGRSKGEAVPVVVLSHMAREKDMLRAVSDIDRLPLVADRTRFIRVEGGER